MMHQLDMITEVQLRHQQAARDARLEQRQLVHRALEQRRARFYQPALVRLGRRMVVWGTQLQRSDFYPAPDVVLAPSNK
ncbi:MAG: hypothetical protein ABI835_18695 [Chloroflexota bacterium]